MARKRVSEKDIVVSAPTAPRHKPAAARPPRRAAVTQADLAAAIEEKTAPLQDEIAQLAYSYWEGRGCQGGSPEEDWLRAERKLSTRVAAATA